MQIERIDLYHLKIPLTEPLSNRFGQMENFETVLVKMQSGDQFGWGEAATGAAPTDDPQWAGGVFAILKRWMAPVVVGQSVANSEALSELLTPLLGHSFAKGALNIAWWDLKAKQDGLPLHKLLGSEKTQLQTGLSIDPHNFGEAAQEQLLPAIQQAISQGQQQFTLKVSAAWNLEMIRMISQSLGIESLRIDFDGCQCLQGLESFYRLDDFQLNHIEQPLSVTDLVGHAMIQERISTPICLDQSCYSLEQVEQALDLHSAQVLNLQPDRTGGFTAAIKMSQLAAEHEVACEVSIGLRTEVGFQAALTLASLPNFSEVIEYPMLIERLGAGLKTLPLVRTDNPGHSTIQLSDQPGLGVQMDDDFLKETAFDHAEIC